MKKLVKWAGIIAAIFALLIILLTVSFMTFVNPNRFKPLITQKVREYTGRQLVMDGDLSWAFFPSLGIKTGHVLLKNPLGFEQDIFAEVNNVTVRVKWMPLFHRKIESSGMTLDGMKLHLIKNAQGQVNWNFERGNKGAGSADASSSGDASSSSLLSVAILGLNITHSEITFTDQQKKESYNLEKFNALAKNVDLLQPFPVTAHFNIVSQPSSMTGEIRLKTNVAMNMPAKVFSLRDVALNARLKKNKQTLNVDVTGDVMADLTRQTLQWENFKAISGQLVLDGKLNVATLSTYPSITGHLQVAPFDLKKWLHDLGQDTSAIQVLKNVSGEIDFVPTVKSTGFKAKFFIDDMTVNDVKMTDVTVPVTYQNGIVELSSVRGLFYQGKLASDIKIDLNSAAPQIAVVANVDDFNVATLLQDLSPKQKLTLTGDGRLTIEITTSGDDKNAILRKLNGTGNASVVNGIMQGMDINYLIASATSLATNQLPSMKDMKQTNFNNLKGSFVIRNGVISNYDFLMSSTEFTTKGQGTIDLVNQAIRYHLQTFLNQANTDKKQLLNLYGLPIPVLVSGSLYHPQVSLDADALTKAMADQQVQKVKSKLEERIQQGKIPEKAGKFLKNLLGH